MPYRWRPGRWGSRDAWQARRAPIDVLTALFERLGQLGTVATGTAPVVLLRHRAVLSAAARYAYEGVDGASPPARPPLPPVYAFHAVRAHRAPAPERGAARVRDVWDG